MYIPRIILAFLVPAVFAQYHTRETRTPSLDFLHTVFGKEALNELPNDDEVARLASLEWARCETDSTKRPFLACTTSTSESVQGPSTVLLLNSERVRVAVVGEFRSALNGLTARPSG